MTVTDMIKTNYVVCTEDTPLERVFEQMDSAGVGHAVVVEGLAHSIPIGVITEHDICSQILGHGRNPRGMTAANVMNTNIVKVSATPGPVDLTSISGAPRIVCVVDENGALCAAAEPKRIHAEPIRAAETANPPSMIRHLQISMANRLY